MLQSDALITGSTSRCSNHIVTLSRLLARLLKQLCSGDLHRTDDFEEGKITSFGQPRLITFAST